MNTLNNLYIRKFHESKIEQYGSDNVQSLAWFTEESQLKRFDILTQIGDLNGSSILDIGCGNGDLCYYLSQKVSTFSYAGIDIMDTFLDNALEKNKQCSTAKFHLGDFMHAELPPADYVFACGSLNYKNSDPGFIFKAISKLYHHSNTALSFNLLSETLNPDGILAAYTSLQIKAYCETLSHHVVIKEGYEKGDFTVWMYK